VLAVAVAMSRINPAGSESTVCINICRDRERRCFLILSARVMNDASIVQHKSLGSEITAY
jgi:hypothetical protein